MLRIGLILAITALTATRHVAAQRENHVSDLSIRGSIGVPGIVSSKMFSASFIGVYEANVSFNLRLFDDFFAGAGYQNSLFRNHSSLLTTVLNGVPTTNTRLMTHGGFMKLGYDQFFSKIGYVSYALNAGFVNYNYKNVPNDTTVYNRPAGPLSISAPYIQPEISVCFIAEKALSFSLFLAYNTVLANYNPKSPRLNHYPEVNSASNSYYMSWINFGFGFQVLLHKK